MMTVLQTLPLPQIGLCTDVDLYVRTPEGSAAWWSFDESAVVLGAGDWVTTDTYFGVFSTGKWSRHTTVGEVEIVAGVSGDVEVEAVHDRSGHGPRVVASGRSTGERGEVVLPLRLHDVGDGHVFLRVRAHRDGARFHSMAVRTSEAPQRDVRLGVSVTTFNRPEYVGANVRRLDAYLGRRDDLGDKVRLLVVDNADNLELAPTEHLDRAPSCRTRTWAGRAGSPAG